MIQAFEKNVVDLEQIIARDESKFKPALKSIFFGFNWLFRPHDFCDKGNDPVLIIEAHIDLVAVTV